VQKAGDKVRVNVQLIDARANRHLWAKSYDRELRDVLAVESEVSQEIAEALKANFSPSESPALASVATRDPEAYDLFLRGEYEVQQAESGQDAYDRAEAFYRQALARDPNFAQAAAGLARTRLLRHWDVSPLAPRELEEVKSIIDRALALAPNSPEAHFALGLFFYYGHRQYEMALAEFNRTLELQPNNAKARQWCAYVYRRRGEWERPDDTLAITDLSWVYLALGRNADALRLSGRAAEAISIAKDALAGPYFQNGLAQIEARAGAPEEAIKRLGRLLSIPGATISTVWLKIDPVWDPIRNRPDFQQLLSGPEQIGPNK
jgi:serine/threonine-protein kinase